MLKVEVEKIFYLRPKLALLIEIIKKSNADFCWIFSENCEFNFSFNSVGIGSSTILSKTTDEMFVQNA
jgi:hypothetical protein